MASPSVLNVKEPLSSGGILHPPAYGDGCHDDTAAIQARLDLLPRSGATSSTCTEGGPESWAPWSVAVYFPAGVYRITEPLRIPYAHWFRLFGDGGRGGKVYTDAPGGKPGGTIIRQDTDDQPIFLFERDYTHSWAIERLGFAWKNPQGKRPAQQGTEEVPPGAVAILFGAVTPGSGQGDSYDYYHGRISACWVHRGWRGVAIDDRTASEGGPNARMSLWNSEVTTCVFSECSGAAVRLKGPQGFAYGMPNNVLRDLFVYNNPNRKNDEPQIEVSEQGTCLLENLDLEGSSHHQPLYVWGTATIRNVHLEHLDIQEPNFRLIFLGGGPTTLSGLTVDGVLDARNASGQPTQGSIIQVYPPSAVLSGLQGHRGIDQSTGGIVLPGGNAFLVRSEPNADVRLMGRPNFPNPHPDPDDPNDPYKYQVYLWNDDDSLPNAPTANVVAEPVKVRVTLSGVSVAPGASATQTVSVPGAKPGDVVSLGAPPDLPAGVIFSGVVVADNTVDIRLFNTNTAGATEDASGLWYVTAGNGPHAGDPQWVDTAAEAAPPWPNPPLPS